MNSLVRSTATFQEQDLERSSRSKLCPSLLCAQTPDSRSSSSTLRTNVFLAVTFRLRFLTLQVGTFSRFPSQDVLLDTFLLKMHCIARHHTNALPSVSRIESVFVEKMREKRRPRRTVQRMTHIQVNNHKTFPKLTTKSTKPHTMHAKRKNATPTPLILHTCTPRSTTRCWRFTVAASTTCSWIHGIGASTIPQRCAVELRANGWKPHNFNDPRHDGTNGLLLLSPPPGWWCPPTLLMPTSILQHRDHASFDAAHSIPNPLWEAPTCFGRSWWCPRMLSAPFSPTFRVSSSGPRLTLALEFIMSNTKPNTCVTYHCSPSQTTSMKLSQFCEFAQSFHSLIMLSCRKLPKAEHAI